MTISTVHGTRGVPRVPKRGTPANFHRFITVPRGHRRTQRRWRGRRGPATLVPQGRSIAPPVEPRPPQGSPSLSFSLSFSPSRLYQLPFDSELRPPPTHAPAFRSVPQSPPTINAIHTKPILAPLAPDLAQCLSHVCDPLGFLHPVGLSPANPTDWIPPRETR